jgi:hypothetical protein
MGVCPGAGAKPATAKKLVAKGAHLPSLAQLVEKAVSSVVLPSPVIETNPASSTVVNLVTWLWIEPSLWTPISAVAKAGGISAIATATPVHVAFSTGDGGSVICDGPGVPYDISEPSSAQSTYCSHVYLNSSAGQQSADGNPDDAAYPIVATITWEVSWRAVGAAGGGVLAPLETSSTGRLRVQQIEAIEQS